MSADKIIIKRSIVRQYFEILNVLMQHSDDQNMSTISKQINGDTIIIKDQIIHLADQGFVTTRDTKLHMKIISITEKGRYFWKTFRELESLFFEIQPARKI